MVVGDVSAAITSLNGLGCNVFDGVDDYVEIPHNEAQLGANLSNGFTISAWVCPRSLGETAGYVIGKVDDINQTNGFALLAFSTTQRFKVNNGTDILSSAIYPAGFGVWRYVLVTYTTVGIGNIYMNGVLSGTANQNGVQGVAAITTTNVMRIGNRSTATDRTFDGAIKDVKMWNRVLSTTEITEEYNGTNHPTGLIHHFKLGGNYTDYGSVGVTATNSGSLPSIVDDRVAAVLKTQYATAGKALSGAYMTISGTPSGQIYSTCIQTKV